MSALSRKLRWYLFRLASMSAAEIAHRIIEAVRRRLDRRLAPPAAVDRGALPALPGLREALTKWQVPDALLEEWRRDHAKAKVGKFFLLGQSWPDCDRARRWHLDPVSGQFWPHDRYCFDVNYRHRDDCGDVKFVWELNRLQYLQTIAALACKQNDREAAFFCLDEIESWIDNNPPYRGINWPSGIELAFRAISIATATSLAGECASATQRAKIWACLEATALWLDRYPSLYSSANNHRAAEGLGLFVIGALCFHQFASAPRWLDRGWAILREAAEKQILPDGVGAEQAISYTAVVLEMLLLGLHIARAQNITVPDVYVQRIAAGGEYLRWFMDAGGNHPQIGDNDNARVFGVYQPDETYARSVLGAIAAATGRGDLTPPDLAPHLRQAVFGFAPPPKAAPSGVRHFHHGGYTVARQTIAGQEAMLAFDHGHLGYLSIAAHGHADALALWLHIGDQPVLVDAGTYLYHSGGAWRDYFRGTRAHNTLSIEDTDSSTMSGHFNWSRKARARLDAWEDGRDQWWALASHDGYRKKFGATHHRRLRADPAGGFAIDDMITGASPRKVAVSFLLHPVLSARQTGESVQIIKDGATLLSMTCDTPLACTIGQAGSAEGGWYSPGFNEKLPAARIFFTGMIAPRQTSTINFIF